MSPVEILRRLKERYSCCRSYTDSGIVTFHSSDSKKENIQFKTEFERPDYLRFEWQDYGPRRGKSESFSTLWSLAGKNIVRSITSQTVIVERDSLQLAVAGATGCSAGAAFMVPSLLIEGLRTNVEHLFQLTELELLREEIVDKQNCYVFKGSLPKTGNHTVWVSSADFSLRHVLQDKLLTAEDSEREHKALMNNKTLMAQLSERGIMPPTDIKYEDRRYVTEYTYSNIFFDVPVVPMPQPVAT